jgi:hypothetical protein
MVTLFMFVCWSAMYLKVEGTKHTQIIRRCDFQCLQQGRCLVTLMLQKKLHPLPTRGSYYFVGCVNLEGFSRKQMATHYCQTAAWLPPASSDFFFSEVPSVKNV